MNKVWRDCAELAGGKSSEQRETCETSKTSWKLEVGKLVSYAW